MMRFACNCCLCFVGAFLLFVSGEFDPYIDNGGTLVGISGSNYCIIASDTRLSESYVIKSRGLCRIFPVSCVSICIRKKSLFSNAFPPNNARSTMHQCYFLHRAAGATYLHYRKFLPSTLGHINGRIKNQYQLTH
jgi:hypothetical protein